MTWPPPAPGAAPSTGLRAGGAEYPASPPDAWPTHAPAPIAPAGSGPGGPLPPPEPGTGRSGAVTAALVAMVVVLVMAGVAVLVGNASDDGDEAATDTTVDLSDPEITAPPSEEPLDPFGTMPSLPGLVPGLDPEAYAQPLDEVLPDLIDFVEQTRGQQFVTDPVVQPVPEDEFEALLAEASAEEGEALDAATVTDVALGLIPPDASLREISEDAGAAGVLGFYEPESDELYVKGDVLTPFVQMVVVHELTHALDDQVVDLGRIDGLLEQADESAAAFLSLVEGTASYVQAQFRDQLSADESSALEMEELQLGMDQLGSIFDIPPAFLVEQQVPYSSGQRFVQALVDADGIAGIDAAYAAPPTTTEQILDPEVYVSGEPAVPLAPLAAGGAVAEEGAFGAVDLRLLEVVSDPVGGLAGDLGTLEPVDGYGGGTFVSWTDGDRSCVRVEVVGDDAAGSELIAEVLDGWAAVVGDADVGTRPGGTGVPVITAERCA